MLSDTIDAMLGNAIGGDHAMQSRNGIQVMIQRSLKRCNTREAFMEFRISEKITIATGGYISCNVLCFLIKKECV